MRTWVLEQNLLLSNLWQRIPSVCWYSVLLPGEVWLMFPFLNSFIHAGQPQRRASQDPPHCPQVQRALGVYIMGDVFPSLVLRHGPAPAAVNVMRETNDPMGLLSDPPPDQSTLRLPSHNADKQERDPFLPSLTQSWKPAPPSPSFPLQGESSTQSTFHILSDSCKENRGSV